MGVMTWPAAHRGVVSSQFQLVPSNLMAVSSYTGQKTPYGPQYARFVANLTFPPKKGLDHRYLQGIITGLRGQKGKVRLADTFRLRTSHDQALIDRGGLPASLWSDGSSWSDGAGWANGSLPPYASLNASASRGDTALALRGLPPDIGDALQIGDLVEFRPAGIAREFGMLHEIVRNARTNADGETLIVFEPGLRMNLAEGDMCVLRAPTSVFNLSSDSEGAMNRSTGDIGSFGLALVEVLPDDL